MPPYQSLTTTRVRKGLATWSKMIDPFRRTISLRKKENSITREIKIPALTKTIQGLRSNLAQHWAGLRSLKKMIMDYCQKKLTSRKQTAFLRKWSTNWMNSSIKCKIEPMSCVRYKNIWSALRRALWSYSWRNSRTFLPDFTTTNYL